MGEGTATHGSIALWARRYIETFGLALVPIEPGEKAPQGKAWNRPGGYFTDPGKAEAFWQQHPTHNLGVVLGPSRCCSLDVDDVPATRQVLYDLLAVDLDALALVSPTVVGNPARFRLLFRLPEGVELSRHALSWPNQADPDGAMLKGLLKAANEAKAAGDQARERTLRASADLLKSFTVFELRAGLVQDLLPPSIHPGTGQPYTWRTPPRAGTLPELPRELLNVWNNWELFKRDAEAACPWAPKPERPAQLPKRRAPPAGERPSVIEAFNQAHDVESLLQAHGYQQRGKKWLCPQSSTGLPGITVAEGRVYSHHGSDPLANGHQNDAFDVFCLLEHGGDVGAATKAAARALGMERSSSSPRHEVPRCDEDASENLPPAPSVGAEAPAEATADPEGDGSLPLTPSLEYESQAEPGHADTHSAGAGGFRISEQELLKDFVVIYGSDLAWDCARARMVKLKAVQEAVGRTTYKWWQESENRRMAQDVVFDPTERCSPLVLNLYDGFHMARGSQGAEGCKRIRAHLQLLCGNRPDEYNFLLRWIAYPLQNPGAKMATAVVMFGSEGPGKSLLWEKVVKRIYGQYGTTIGQAQLEDKYTGWQSRKLFALAEEVVSREEMRHYKGVLKHLVTGDTLQIDEKYQSVREERNHLNFVFLSNSTVPLALDDGDRRYLVLYIDKVPPASYFSALVEEIEGGGVENFYDYLMGLDLTGFGPHSKPPVNEEKQGLIDGSLPAPRYFVRRWMAGETDFPVTGAVTQHDLWQAFVRWCDGSNEFKRRQRDFSQEVVRDLKQERPDISYPTKSDPAKTTRIYVTPAFLEQKSALGRGWASQAAEECRRFGRHFERRSLPPSGAFD